MAFRSLSKVISDQIDRQVQIPSVSKGTIYHIAIGGGAGDYESRAVTGDGAYFRWGYSAIGSSKIGGNSTADDIPEYEGPKL